jgi:hypothetical protein
MASALVGGSLLFAPERGIVWSLWRQRLERIRLAQRNVLLGLYRHAQSHGDVYASTPEELITGLYDGEGKRALHWLQQHDQAFKTDRRWRLTTAGVQAAEHALADHPVTNAGD